MMFVIEQQIDRAVVDCGWREVWKSNDYAKTRAEFNRLRFTFPTWTIRFLNLVATYEPPNEDRDAGHDADGGGS